MATPVLTSRIDCFTSWFSTFYVSCLFTFPPPSLLLLFMFLHLLYPDILTFVDIQSPHLPRIPALVIQHPALQNLLKIIGAKQPVGFVLSKLPIFLRAFLNIELPVSLYRRDLIPALIEQAKCRMADIRV